MSATGVAVRVIPCLDVDGGRVVKGVNFVGLRDAGDPVELAGAYDADGADELVFLDITASSDERETMYDVLARLEDDGCARYVVTDVTKDGTLTGPNLDLLRQVCARTDRPVIASGGVSSLDDLRAIAGLVPVGVTGAIVGKALYAGVFTLPEALAAVS